MLPFDRLSSTSSSPSTWAWFHIEFKSLWKTDALLSWASLISWFGVGGGWGDELLVVVVVVVEVEVVEEGDFGIVKGGIEIPLPKPIPEVDDDEEEDEDDVEDEDDDKGGNGLLIFFLSCFSCLFYAPNVVYVCICGWYVFQLITIALLDSIKKKSCVVKNKFEK